MLAGIPQFSTSAPYVIGVRDLRDCTWILVFSFILIVLPLYILRRIDNKEVSDDDKFPLKRRYPLLDHDTVNAILHADQDHKTNIIDNDHEYYNVTMTAIVDCKQDYYGIYERHGQVVNENGSDGILVHASASKVGLSFDDLSVVAIDMTDKVRLYVEQIEEQHRCKVWKIRFRTVKRQGQEFHIRWMYTWPNSMSLVQDGDLLSFLVFSNPPTRFKLSMQLPGDPIVCESVLLYRDRNQLCPLDKKVVDTNKNFFYFELMGNYHQDLTGALIVYQIESHKKGLCQLRDMVHIVQARESDLDEIFLLERTIEEKDYAASRETLYERLRMFPEGFLVAKVGENIIGYIQSCIWNKKNIQHMMN